MKEQTEIRILQSEVESWRKTVQELEAKLARQEEVRSAQREDHSFRIAVIERAAEGVCVCHGPYVEFTVWNSRMTEITGYTLEDINQLGWYQKLYPDPDVQRSGSYYLNFARK